MVEDGDADRFAIDGAIIITPIRAFAPGFAVADAGAVDDMALADFALEAHGLGQAHGHGAFLGVAEDAGRPSQAGG